MAQTTEELAAEIAELAGDVPISTWVLRALEAMLPLLRRQRLAFVSTERSKRIQALITPEIDAEIETLRGDVPRPQWASAAIEWCVGVIRDSPALAEQLATPTNKRHR